MSDYNDEGAESLLLLGATTSKKVVVSGTVHHKIEDPPHRPGSCGKTTTFSWGFCFV